jgi:glycosyltransferase involved in cell wall biosynthesis
MSYKIAIISSSTPPKVSGGISSANWNLYLALKRAGFTVRIFTYNDDGCRGYQNGDVVRHGAPAIWLRLSRIVGMFYRIILQLVEGQVDYAYQLFYVLNSIIGARRINRSLKTFHPDVVILPDNGSPGYFISPPAGCKKIFISHHNYLRFVDEPIIGRFSELDAKLAMYFERKTVSRMDTVICPSSYMKEVFMATHRYQATVEVIPNIVDQDLISSILATDMHRLMNLHPESPIVYIPSAGTRFKGSRFTFEIIRRLSAACRQIGFYLTGTIMDDTLRRELKHIPNNAQLYCPGHSDYADNISMIKGCSFCVSPTLIESFGMAILEANFCGLPVVAFNAGGNADIITNGLNGFLMPFLDVEALISASTSLLERNLNSEMSSKTLLLVNKLFATDKIIERYIDVILNSKPAAPISGRL